MPAIGPVTPGEAGGWNSHRPRPQSAPFPAGRREGQPKSDAPQNEPLLLWPVTLEEWTPAWHHEGPWPARVQIAMYRESGAEELEPEVEIRRIDFRA